MAWQTGSRPPAELLGYAFSESFAHAADTATRVALVAILLATAAFTIRSRWRRDRNHRLPAPGTRDARPR